MRVPVWRLISCSVRERISLVKVSFLRVHFLPVTRRTRPPGEARKGHLSYSVSSQTKTHIKLKQHAIVKRFLTRWCTTLSTSCFSGGLFSCLSSSRHPVIKFVILQKCAKGVISSCSFPPGRVSEKGASLLLRVTKQYERYTSQLHVSAVASLAAFFAATTLS